MIYVQNISVSFRKLNSKEWISFLPKLVLKVQYYITSIKQNLTQFTLCYKLLYKVLNKIKKEVVALGEWNAI